MIRAKLIEERLRCKEDAWKMNRLFARLKKPEIWNRRGLITQLVKQFIYFRSRAAFVGLQKDDVVFFEKTFCCFSVQSEPLCSFARRSPIGGEVHEHRPPFF